MDIVWFIRLENR